MHLARLQFKGIFDRLRLSFVWHDAEDVSRFENLADRHGDRLARDLLGTAKPSFTDLLAPASLIKCHDDVRFFSIKIGRGIVERQMPVLAYADKGRINCLATNQFSQTTTLYRRISSIPVHDMKCPWMYMAHDAFVKILPKTRRMRFGKSDILVQMKEGGLGPINIRLLNQGLEKFKL